MPAESLSTGRCVFCAFRSQQWPFRRTARLQPFSSNSSHAYLRRPPQIRPSTNINKASVKAGVWRLDVGQRVEQKGQPQFRKGSFVEKRPPIPRSNRSLREEKSREDAANNTQTFHEIVRSRLSNLQSSILSMNSLNSLGSSPSTWDVYKKFVSKNIEGKYNVRVGYEERKRGMGAALQQAFISRAILGLDAQLKHFYYGFLSSKLFTKQDVISQRALADLRFPHEWYPATRGLSRTVHVHVGPTNSGKTYHALKRLEESESGIYGGPLRLLAHEVFSRLNAKGLPCWLVTGEERRKADGTNPKMFSCTVEMIPLNTPVEVAVLDEIQMIGNTERGWAWTQAFLGVMANEVHVCGEERAVPLIRELCAAVGDKIEIHRYERLTPLKMEPVSLGGDWNNLRKGDAVICFSVLGIHSVKKQIEAATGRKVAIVYGSLPPETRAQQARLFNDPGNDYDIIVASDAIGMGLNLSIKRVIFEASMKHDGTRFGPLNVADVKQIAGRAGRFRTAHQAIQEGSQPAINDETHMARLESHKNIDLLPSSQIGAKQEDDAADRDSRNAGLVTTFEDFDYPYIATRMQSDPEPLMSAGLTPPDNIIERFSNYFPSGTPFSYILARLHEICHLHPRYHLCTPKDALMIADVIQEVEDLTVSDRLIFCASPTGVRDEAERKLLQRFARIVANQSGGSILDIPDFELELLDITPTHDDLREHLRGLEHLHKSLILYLWLSYRFPGVFTTRVLGFHLKALVEDQIEKCLEQYSYTKTQYSHLKEQRKKQFLNALQEDIDLQAAEGIPGSAKQIFDIQAPSTFSNDATKDPVTTSMRSHDDVGEYPNPELHLVDDTLSKSRQADQPSTW